VLLNGYYSELNADTAAHNTYAPGATFAGSAYTLYRHAKEMLNQGRYRDGEEAGEKDRGRPDNQ
jgi:hypothetical protein